MKRTFLSFPYSHLPDFLVSAYFTLSVWFTSILFVKLILPLSSHLQFRLILLSTSYSTSCRLLFSTFYLFGLPSVFIIVIFVSSTVWCLLLSDASSLFPLVFRLLSYLSNISQLLFYSCCRSFFYDILKLSSSCWSLFSCISPRYCTFLVELFQIFRILCYFVFKLQISTSEFLSLNFLPYFPISLWMQTSNFFPCSVVFTVTLFICYFISRSVLHFFSFLSCWYQSRTDLQIYE